jgi:hypothetical protein
MNSLHQPGARHCADVAGAFSPGWTFERATRQAVLTGNWYLPLDGPLWQRAHMSADTRALLVRWLLGGYARA